MEASQTMSRASDSLARVVIHDSLLKRVLWLYGLYILINSAAYLIGYYVLPEGFLRGSPVTTSGQIAASQTSFRGQFGTILLFNIGWVTTLCFVLNFIQVKGFPLGYLMVLSLGLITGLISGSNSFVSSDLNQFSAHEGMALNLSIGGLETLGYILVLAATVRLGIYQYRSWWQWRGEWAPQKVMRIRDIRLTGGEWLTIAAGSLVIILGAYRETLLAFGQL